MPGIKEFRLQITQINTVIKAFLIKKLPTIFQYITKNNKDQQWAHDNEAWAMVRKISLLLWNYFDLKDNWEPAVK